MRRSGEWLRRQVACGLVVILAVPFAQGATTASTPTQAVPSQQGNGEAAPGPHNQASPGGQAPSSNQPAPDAQASPNTPAPDSQTPAAGSNPPQQNPAPPQQGTPTAPPKPTDNAPVGTAAAPYEKAAGNAASRPAGAAIAPAKQKRTRSILIRVGILVGAAVAIGTVVGLSESSSSRPN